MSLTFTLQWQHILTHSHTHVHTYFYTLTFIQTESGYIEESFSRIVLPKNLQKKARCTRGVFKGKQTNKQTNKTTLKICKYVAKATPITIIITTTIAARTKTRAWNNEVENDDNKLNTLGPSVSTKTQICIQEHRKNNNKQSSVVRKVGKQQNKRDIKKVLFAEKKKVLN